MGIGYWLYKNNAIEGGPAGYSGDWVPDVFDDDQVGDWGGHYSTRSREVSNYLNEDVRPGDVVVAYQTDDKEIVGFCQVERLEGPPDDKHLFLKPIYRLETPLKIHTAKIGTILERSSAVNGRVMMRPLSRLEMREILRLSHAPLALLHGTRRARASVRRAEMASR